MEKEIYWSKEVDGSRPQGRVAPSRPPTTQQTTSKPVLPAQNDDPTRGRIKLTDSTNKRPPKQAPNHWTQPHYMQPKEKVLVPQPAVADLFTTSKPAATSKHVSSAKSVAASKSVASTLTKKHEVLLDDTPLCHNIISSNGGVTRRPAGGNVSIQDLNPEDKKKIANLIQELATLSEEHQRLKDALDGHLMTQDAEKQSLVSERELLEREKSTLEEMLMETKLELDSTKDKLEELTQLQKQQQQQKERGNGDRSSTRLHLPSSSPRDAPESSNTKTSSKESSVARRPCFEEEQDDEALRMARRLEEDKLRLESEREALKAKIVDQARLLKVKQEELDRAGLPPQPTLKTLQHLPNVQPGRVPSQPSVGDQMGHHDHSQPVDRNVVNTQPVTHNPSFNQHQSLDHNCCQSIHHTCGQQQESNELAATYHNTDNNAPQYHGSTCKQTHTSICQQKVCENCSGSHVQAYQVGSQNDRMVVWQQNDFTRKDLCQKPGNNQHFEESRASYPPFLQQSDEKTVNQVDASNNFTDHHEMCQARRGIQKHDLGNGQPAVDDCLKDRVQSSRSGTEFMKPNFPITSHLHSTSGESSPEDDVRNHNDDRKSTRTRRKTKRLPKDKERISSRNKLPVADNHGKEEAGSNERKSLESCFKKSSRSEFARNKTSSPSSYVDGIPEPLSRKDYEERIRRLDLPSLFSQPKEVEATEVLEATKKQMRRMKVEKTSKEVMGGLEVLRDPNSFIPSFLTLVDYLEESKQTKPRQPLVLGRGDRWVPLDNQPHRHGDSLSVNDDVEEAAQLSHLLDESGFLDNKSKPTLGRDRGTSLKPKKSSAPGWRDVVGASDCNSEYSCSDEDDVLSDIFFTNRQPSSISHL